MTRSKIYEELWNKIRFFIRSILNNPHNYNEKHMPIKLGEMMIYL